MTNKPEEGQHVPDTVALLEAQAKRIAELEKREKHLEEMFHGWRDEAKKASARIAELEAENKALRAALKPFADRYGEITKMLGGVTQDYAVLTVDVGFGDLCTARAALKGEKAS